MQLTKAQFKKKKKAKIIGSTMHNNISALYTRHITSLPTTRFYDIREPHNVAQQHQCNIQKKKKKKKNRT